MRVRVYAYVYVLYEYLWRDSMQSTCSPYSRQGDDTKSTQKHEICVLQVATSDHVVLPFHSTLGSEPAGLECDQDGTSNDYQRYQSLMRTQHGSRLDLIMLTCICRVTDKAVGFRSVMPKIPLTIVTILKAHVVRQKTEKKSTIHSCRR
eukprot:Blabericola_migrator_1__5598@NODE_284_length_10386_cov_93_763155_g234_i0_p5_GENE_NODE_284_length_10386_cov_93_763155_g234_i0NODE_284_length_10386_cov_93_763155_g234_i0_p5_ORF_typecomplete_len149_score11_66_NODE_284_length_10386_cov_93_763155_g234_i0209655